MECYTSTFNVRREKVIQQWNVTRQHLTLEEKKLFNSGMLHVTGRNKAGYHGKHLPALSSLKRVVSKFKEFGLITERRKGKKSAITSTEIKKVERLYRNRQLISLRLQISRWNFLRLSLLKKAYKSRVRMLLTERHRQARIAAARHLLTRLSYPKRGLQRNSGFIRCHRSKET